MSYDVGDRVLAEPVWKFENATGTVIKKTSNYIIVKWDGINGDWRYTEAQSEKLKLLKELDTKET